MKFLFEIRRQLLGNGQFDVKGPIVVTCSLDGGPATTCGSPLSYEGLSAGDHEVVITANDDVGVMGATLSRFNVADDPAEVADGVAAQTADPITPAPAPATPATPTSVSGVLAYTGAHIEQFAIVGLMLLATGLVLGSVAAFARRRSD